jgi:tyrosine decarboxylase/aspartate 1-decarboxylase
LLPLTVDGEFAGGLAAGHRAALELDRRLHADNRFVPSLGSPQLDIVVWKVSANRVEDSSERARRIFDRCASLQLHLALVQLPEATFAVNSGAIPPGHDWRRAVTCLRSVLMKPQHEEWIDEIWDRLGTAARIENAGIGS